MAVMSPSKDSAFAHRGFGPKLLHPAAVHGAGRKVNRLKRSVSLLVVCSSIAIAAWLVQARLVHKEIWSAAADAADVTQIVVTPAGWSLSASTFANVAPSRPGDNPIQPQSVLKSRDLALFWLLPTEAFVTSVRDVTGLHQTGWTWLRPAGLPGGSIGIASPFPAALSTATTWVKASVLGVLMLLAGLVLRCVQQSRALAAVRQTLHERDSQLARLRIEQDRAAEAEQRKDETLAVIAHEMRTPLVGAIGMLDILGKPGTPGEKEVRIGATIGAMQVLLRLLDDILDIKNQGGALVARTAATFAPKDLLMGLVKLIEPEAQAGGNVVQADLPGSLPQLTGDSGRIAQIVLNLLSNAAKFTRNGTIKLSLSLDHQGASKVDLRIDVTDTGPGISVADQKTIFGRFVRLAAGPGSAQPGLGLGLAISRELAEAMGGRISVSSVPGCGSRFTLVLPLQIATATPVERPVDRRLAGRTIVVVDDNAMILEIMTLQLHSAGAHVWAAETADQAFALINRHRPDAVISDLALPDKDGFALLRMIRARYPASVLPVIAYSGHLTDAKVKTCLDAEFSATILKGCDIVPVVEAALACATRPRVA